MTQKDKIRIGVYICRCGSNIAGVVDCEAVTSYAATLPGVVHTAENLYTCSESGIAEIQEAVREHNLNRVVVASCSPRTHQPLFQNACAEAGLNPYLFEMANIRDQCSWVHMKAPEKATQKAKDLVRMAAAKSVFLEPRHDIESSLIPRALIIGGGIAGLSAAETLTGMGLETVLVEKSGKLGGLLTQIAPAAFGSDNDNFLPGIIERTTNAPNLTLYLSSRVKSITGYIGNYEAVITSDDGNSFTEKVGCIAVATGAVPLRPDGMFGYDGQTVISQMDLETRLRNGPIGAQNIVMIQCVGARNEEREYCSRICCLTAVKNAMKIKKQNPKANVCILYRDIQMYGTEKEKMLNEARGMGVRFEIYNPDNPPALNNGRISFYQSVLGETMEAPFDLVVLSTPLIAREDAGDLARMMRLPTDRNRFFMEAHAKLRPLDFASDGIFLCGSARFPAAAREARSQGLGVAARMGAVLFKEKLVSSAIIAEIDSEKCVGCQGCLNMCPFEAVFWREEEKVCEVNPILCKGCGCCAASCPSQSSQLKGFNYKQLFSQIRAMFA